MTPQAFSFDGYIINQQEMKTVPYGKHGSDYNGCGWIAAYNALHAVQKDTSWQAVHADFEAGFHLANASLGTGPFRIVRYLKAQSLAVQGTLLCKTAALRMGTAKAGVVLYAARGGIHYAAFSATEQRGSLRFFNAVYGAHRHVQPLAHFVRAYANLPFVLYLTIQ